MTTTAPTLSFTALERGILKEIAACEPIFGSALQSQFDAATVTRRENTGVGFYTDFAVPRTVGPVSTPERVIGHVVAEIAGLTAPMIFLVFVEEGFATLLEGAVLGDDSTVDIDLHALEFRILPD